ncbi:aldehyde ferredoxin oxidoreductase, partial [bacterium]|nr:aldehyde ferredoxin oxidoreductase [bacterium]
IIGKEMDTEKILKIGERIVNIERLFNLREGFTRTDDTLPKRLLEEPLNSGPAKGEVMELDVMLDEYYETRGWDREGIPTKEKLDELGLGDYYGEI